MKQKIETELLNILKEIVKIDTCYPPGSSKKFSEYVRKYLKNSGLKVKSFGVNQNKPNIVVSNKFNSSKSLVLINSSTSIYFPGPSQFSFLKSLMDETSLPDL